MTSKKSSLLRMDNVGIMVEDMDAMVAFLEELGMEVEGKATVEGEHVDRLIALDGTRCDIVMMKTPDGHSRIELSKFLNPKPIATDRNAPVNALGIRRLMFAVTNMDDVIARLEKHGGSLIGEVTTYEDIYKLSYLRGPEGIMIALAEQLGEKTVEDILKNS